MDLQADERGRTTGTTLLLWGVALLGALLAVSVAVSLLLSVVATVVTLVATALVLGGIGYLLATWMLGGDEASRGRSRSRTGRSDAGGRESLLDRVPDIETGDRRGDVRSDDPIDRLTERYVSGEIDEAEYEQRLERHLGGPDAGSLDDAGGRRSRTSEYER